MRDRVGADVAGRIGGSGQRAAQGVTIHQALAADGERQRGVGVAIDPRERIGGHRDRTRRHRESAVREAELIALGGRQRSQCSGNGIVADVARGPGQRVQRGRARQRAGCRITVDEASNAKSQGRVCISVIAREAVRRHCENRRDPVGKEAASRIERRECGCVGDVVALQIAGHALQRRGRRIGEHCIGASACQDERTRTGTVGEGSGLGADVDRPADARGGQHGAGAQDDIAASGRTGIGHIDGAGRDACQRDITTCLPG